MNKQSKERNEKILRQVRLNRQASRQVALELGLNKVNASVHLTSKKDQKRANTVRSWDHE